jgi:alcohol dehydrogenase YqhD (iron-dependent ADH family)
MLNFSFQNTTKIHFGEGQIKVRLKRMGYMSNLLRH